MRMKFKEGLVHGLKLHNCNLPLTTNLNIIYVYVTISTTRSVDDAFGPHLMKIHFPFLLKAVFKFSFCCLCFDYFLAKSGYIRNSDIDKVNFVFVTMKSTIQQISLCLSFIDGKPHTSIYI